MHSPFFFLKYFLKFLIALRGNYTSYNGNYQYFFYFFCIICIFKKILTIPEEAINSSITWNIIIHFLLKCYNIYLFNFLQNYYRMALFRINCFLKIHKPDLKLKSLFHPQFLHFLQRESSIDFYQFNGIMFI